MSSPVFVVVGHVNRGKSSIVATLAADDSVRIDATPGTTVHCREYPAVVAGQRLYTLIDTPGFERPRQALAWLTEHERGTHERADVVERFVRAHAGGEVFRQECELLRPILDGAAILYVVDGSTPPSPKDEAEMEILRWTARPRIALINLIDKPAKGGADFTTQWRQVLDQYFNLVRVFDAHEAQFDDRIRLLRTLREMDSQFAPPLTKAIDTLIEDRHFALRESAEEVADMLVEMLSLVEEKRLPRSTSTATEADREALSQRYFEALRRRERKCHRQIQEIFLHHRLEIAETDLTPAGEDLFAEATWIRFGLTRGQLVTAGATTGGAAGLAIDAAVGGHSFLLGAVIGTAVGGVLGWYGAWQLPSVKVRGIPLGGRLLRIGPMSSANFPWIVLDRALTVIDLVTRRAHARRDIVQLALSEARASIVAQLPREVRNQFESYFARLRKSPGAGELDDLRGELADVIEKVLAERHPIDP